MPTFAHKNIQNKAVTHRWHHTSSVAGQALLGKLSDLPVLVGGRASVLHTLHWIPKTEVNENPYTFPHWRGLSEVYPSVQLSQSSFIKSLMKTVMKLSLTHNVCLIYTASVTIDTLWSVRTQNHTAGWSYYNLKI